MVVKVSCVILASCSAEWMEQIPARTLSATLGRVATPHSVAFAPIGKLPALSYPLFQLRKCARLLPLDRSTYIVTNDDAMNDMTKWVAEHGSPLGLSVANVLSNGRSSQQGYAPVHDVAAFVEAVRPSGHVLVIDLTSLTAPQFDMQQFIESAVLSMAPVVAARLTKDGEPSVGLTRLELEGSDRRARGVVGVSGFSDPFCDGEAMCAAPVAFLRAENLGVAATVAAAEDGAQLADLYAELLRQGPVRALTVDTCLPLRSAEDCLFASHYVHVFLELLKAQAKERRHMPLSQPGTTAVDAVGRGPRHKMLHRAAEATTLGELAFSGTLGAVAAVLDSAVLDAEEVLAEAAKTFGEADEFGSMAVPARFADVHAWNVPAVGQHPCYTTTSASYGRLRPRQAEMPLEWHGLDGAFTKGIPFMPSTTGLNTATTRSRVHPTLDPL